MPEEIYGNANVWKNKMKYEHGSLVQVQAKRKKYLLNRQRAWKVKKSTCHSYRNSGERVKESSVDDQQYEKTVGEMVKSKGPGPSKCRRLTSFLLIGNLRENKTVEVLHCYSILAVNVEAAVLEVALARLLPAGTTGSVNVTNSASDLHVLFSQPFLIIGKLNIQL
ncbi:hypothetical protein CBL_08558 [Carabus blaptoides fortunei]